MTARLRQVLAVHLRAGRCVTYRDLAIELAMPPPHRIHELTLLLEELVREDHAAGHALLAAVAVGRSGLPGRGFFQLLAELGRYDGSDQGAEAAACHADLLAAARQFYCG